MLSNEDCAKDRVSVIILEKKVRKYKKCKEKYRNVPLELLVSIDEGLLSDRLFFCSSESAEIRS